MEKIKKIVLYAAIFMTTTCNLNFLGSVDLSGLASASKKWIEFAKSQEGQELLKLMGGTVNVLADGTIEITRTLTDGSIAVSKVLADGTVLASSKIGVEAIKEMVRLGEKCIPLAWGCLTLVAVYEGYTIVKDIKSTSSELRKSSTKDASENLKYEEDFDLRKAKKDLRLSMVKNAKGRRGASGLPIACEEDVKRLIMAGGQAECEQLAQAFKKCYGEASC